MVKKPFFIFVLIISGLISGLLWFTQSPQFARVLKSVASKYLPQDAGISGDFSEISINFFPPGFSLKNAEFQLGSRNLVQLPAGSKIVAERVDFGFLPFQILSGDIRVHEVTLINGEVSLVLDPAGLKKKPAAQKARSEFHWDELFQVRAEGIAVQNVRFNLRLGSSDSMTCQVNNLKFAQWSGKGGLGYSLDLNLAGVQGSYLKKLSFPNSANSIDKVEGKLYVNALGIQIESLSIASEGIDASLLGQVKGNVLDPKTLLVDGKATVEGKLAQLIKWTSYSVPKGADIEGVLRFTGGVQGNLLKPMETLKANGSIALNHLSFLKWRADLIEADGIWEASPSGGEISVEKITVNSKVQDQVVGKLRQQIGGGGKIEAGPVKWIVGSTAPIAVPLKFENAHVHWLGAGSLKEVFPLNFRLNGTIRTTIFPEEKGQPWQVQAQLASWVDKFQLSNQRLNEVHRLKAVFSVPRLDLNGGLVINASGLHPENLYLSLPHTKMKLTGKIDFKSGYDLKAFGQVNFADLGHIAENEIRGQGTLALQVKGPTERVIIDIDVDAKDASYLSLDLGTLKGRLVWDDGPQYLIFKKPQLTKATTHYTVDGYLDLGKNDDAHINVVVSQGNIHDFIQVFHNLTDDIWWFPHLLNGPFSGSMKITGGLSLDQVHILAELNGTNWEQWGERFKSVYLLGGFDRGKYYLKDLQALKRLGYLAGNISYEANKKFTWNLESEDFSVNDLDYLTKLNVPIRGTLKLKTTGEGIGANIRSNSLIELKDFKVRGVSMAPSSLALRTQEGIVNALASVMGKQGVIDARYDLNPKEMSYLHSELTQLDFSPVLMLFNTKAIQDQHLAGYLSGSLNLKFHSGKIEKANGNLAISEYLLARSDTKFSLVHPVMSKVEEGSFNIGDLAIQGKGGEAALDLQSKGGDLKGSIHGELDNSIAEFFSSALIQASGMSNLDLKIAGTLKKPTITGGIDLDEAAFRLSALDSQFENVTGSFFLKDSVLSFKNLIGDLGDGKISAGGRITLYSNRYPELNLEGTATGAKVRIYPFQYAKVNGNIKVHGQSPPYLVDGSVKVLSAVTKEKFLSTRQRGGGLKALQYTPPQSLEGEGNFSKFKLDIAVEAPRGIFVQNDLFRDVEVKGSLNLVNTLDAPGILGTAEVLQGKMIFKDHIFHITSAGAKFDNPNSFDPSFDLNANTEVNGVKIQMYVTGKTDKMKIEFTSTPTMPESEILSLLAVGITSNDAKRLSANDLSVLQQGEAASLVLHSLDFNRDLEDKTGFQVQLDQS
ncbi:MAG: translocation/assembly module TamB domain-containing protein, partial [Bdellovibrionia bacterium]